MGNSKQGLGYGCQLPALVRSWRQLWSTTPSTTDPSAPFGIVTLAAGGDEGGTDIGGMRFSQTANMGVCPNEQMPNTFLAQVRLRPVGREHLLIRVTFLAEGIRLGRPVGREHELPQLALLRVLAELC